MAALSLAGLLAPAVLAAPLQADVTGGWPAEIAAASARFGIPEPWIRVVIRLESGGRTELNGRPIRSPKGAMGLMQLMPGTWQEMRGRHGLGTDPDAPADNILAGTAYLRFLYDQFGYPGLFAAYNAGPARYRAWRERGVPLPAETRAYLAAALARLGAPAMPAVNPPPPEDPDTWRTLFVPLGGGRPVTGEPQ
jgi:soluble lytic murein transglycosylase-like protein